MKKILLFWMLVGSFLKAHDPFSGALADHAQGKPATLLIMAVKEMRENKAITEIKLQQLENIIKTIELPCVVTSDSRIESLERRLYLTQNAIGAAVIVLGVGMTYLAYKRE